MDSQDSLRAIERALSTLRVSSTPGEYDLHRMIAQALGAADIEYRHEVALGPRCRIDFLVNGVGIEVKKGRVCPRKLREQARRYLISDQLCALMLVTTRGADLPASLLGKPIRVFGLARLWGVSLP